MRIKNKGFEITIIVGLIVFSLIIFGIYLIVEIINSNKSYTLFLKPYTILECVKWDCKNVSDKINDYNSKSYNIFFDGNKSGVYEMYYNSRNEKYYVFDNRNNNIYNNEKILAYSGKAMISQKNYQSVSVTKEELNDLQLLTNISLDIENIYKVVKDFDNDGEEEGIFTINNGDGEPTLFSILIYKDKEKYKILDKKVSNDIASVGFSYISNVLDIFEDGKLEFIYTTSYYDEIGSCNVLYRLKGKNFVPVNECEIVR